jgi:hypothetical protein
MILLVVTSAIADYACYDGSETIWNTAEQWIDNSGKIDARVGRDCEDLMPLSCQQCDDCSPGDLVNQNREQNCVFFNSLTVSDRFAYCGNSCGPAGPARICISCDEPYAGPSDMSMIQKNNTWEPHNFTYQDFTANTATHINLTSISKPPGRPIALSKNDIITASPLSEFQATIHYPTHNTIIDLGIDETVFTLGSDIFFSGGTCTSEECKQTLSGAYAVVLMDTIMVRLKPKQLCFEDECMDLNNDYDGIFVVDDTTVGIWMADENSTTIDHVRTKCLCPNDFIYHSASIWACVILPIDVKTVAQNCYTEKNYGVSCENEFGHSLVPCNNVDVATVFKPESSFNLDFRLTNIAWIGPGVLIAVTDNQGLALRADNYSIMDRWDLGAPDTISMVVPRCVELGSACSSSVQCCNYEPYDYIAYDDVPKATVANVVIQRSTEPPTVFTLTSSRVNFTGRSESNPIKLDPLLTISPVNTTVPHPMGVKAMGYNRPGGYERFQGLLSQCDSTECFDCDQSSITSNRLLMPSDKRNPRVRGQTMMPNTSFIGTFFRGSDINDMHGRASWGVGADDINCDRNNARDAIVLGTNSDRCASTNGTGFNNASFAYHNRWYETEAGTPLWPTGAKSEFGVCCVYHYATFGTNGYADNTIKSIEFHNVNPCFFSGTVKKNRARQGRQQTPKERTRTVIASMQQDSASR